LVDKVDCRHHVVAANEGNAVALAAGHYLATGGVACVYMQNSGLGNTVNPLVSLADPSVYGIPMLLLIGWRGESGIPDEPQHIRQGELSQPLLDVLGIPSAVLPSNRGGADAAVAEAVLRASKRSGPAALLVRRNTFDLYKAKALKDAEASLSRERALGVIVSRLSETDIVVSTTGKISRELYEIREREGMPHHSDFLTVGSMGHASQIATGVALSSPTKRVVCLDGDGALLMHMGGVAVGACLELPNFRHIVLNNGAHDSVGGMATVGLSISFSGIAGACGYSSSQQVCSEGDLRAALTDFLRLDGPSLLDVVVSRGARKDLGRPHISPAECKHSFMEFVAR
jgi:phosphonopyruvate decarboxylase